MQPLSLGQVPGSTSRARYPCILLGAYGRTGDRDPISEVEYDEFRSALLGTDSSTEETAQTANKDISAGTVYSIFLLQTLPG